MAFLRASAVPLCLATAVAATLAMTSPRSHAATFVWGGSTGTWTTGPSWQGGSAPSGANTTDVLTFGGDALVAAYTSTNNFGSPFLINQLLLQASGAGGSHVIAADPGSSIALGGNAPQILQNGAGGFTVSAPIELRANTTFGGNGAGVVTLNGAVTGNFDITKTGTSTFRFGSLVGDADPSANKWFGTLNLQGGTVRFNNNVATARTALRSNPVVQSAGSVLTATSELRAGTLSGTGSVSTTADGTDGDSNSIVLHALQDGTYSGALAIGAATGQGKNDGLLVVRGPGTQRFTGSLSLSGGDVVVGRGATMILSGTATLSSETKGAVVMQGGTFVLDNSNGGTSNRLRGTAFDTDSTGLESIGGGTFKLVGSTAGTNEVMARLQLGSVSDGTPPVSKPRSGALNISIVHNAGAAATVLNFASYTRSGVTDTPGAKQYATVNFTAENGNGTVLALGQTGNNPRVLFSGSGFTVPLSSNSNLLNSTGGAVDVGWATINGTDFASYDSTNGVVAATTLSFPLGTSGTNPGNASANYLLATSTFLTANFSAQSVKLAPTQTGRILSLGARTLTTQGFVLGGDFDFSISAGTGGAIDGSSTRYFYVNKATLNVSAPIVGTGTIVKSGAGTLNLTGGNSTNSSAVVINQGQVRASLTGLPGGELRFRGGVLEFTGGTFSRPVGSGAGNVNWNGFDGFAPVGEDRGSGGFAAVGGDVTVDLGGGAQTGFTWEGNSFVNSGHALVFGSRAATHKVNWVDNLNLTAAGTINYNAREIQVLDNADPGITSDRLQMSGTISGSVHNDLLKTGAGVLELSGTNTFAGATIVHEGTLLVNGENSESFLTEVKSGARLGGTGKIRTARIEAGGTLAPGELSGVAQTGRLTVNGDLSFNSATSKLQIEIALGAHDSVEVNGGVSLSGAELIGSLLNGFLAAPNDLFFLIINDGTDAVQGTFSQGSLVSFGGQSFQISYTGDFGTNSFTSGNDVVLRAVPEPSAGLLAGTAALLLGGMRRLRRARRGA